MPKGDVICGLCRQTFTPDARGFTKARRCPGCREAWNRIRSRTYQREINAGRRVRVARGPNARTRQGDPVERKGHYMVDAKCPACSIIHKEEWSGAIPIVMPRVYCLKHVSRRNWCEGEEM